MIMEDSGFPAATLNGDSGLDCMVIKNTNTARNYLQITKSMLQLAKAGARFSSLSVLS